MLKTRKLLKGRIESFVLDSKILKGNALGDPHRREVQVYLPEGYDEDKARRMEERMRKAEFTFDDFLDQLRQLRKLGSLKSVLGMMPGMNAKALKNAQVDEKALVRTEAIICSMTKQERARPDILNGSRRKRIARGSGVDVADVNRLLKQHKQMQRMMKKMGSKGGMKNMMRGLKGKLPPGGMPF